MNLPKMKISVDNLDEFKKLTKKFNDDIEALADDIAKLNDFNLKVDIKNCD